MPSAIAVIFYLGAWALLLHFALRRENLKPSRVLLIIAIGALAHSISVFSAIKTPTGYSFGFFSVASLIFFAINVIVATSSIRKPLHNLFLLLLPLSILAILLSILFDASTKAETNLSTGIVIHILFSVLAYAIFTIASFHALLLAYQNHKLKNKHPRGVMGLLPPLQTMETLLFELVWAGEILLSLALITGSLFLEDMFAQHLAHKVVLSILAWLIYAILLFGRHVLAWGGTAAIKWAIGGFAVLATAYFGSKFVLEFVLV